MNNNVFERKLERGQSRELIQSAYYNLIIGLVLFWGFAVNWLMIQLIPVQSIAKINVFVFLLAYLASCFLGIYLFVKSSNPWISFLGYNFVVVPFGLILNIIISPYDPALVMDAVRMTGQVTLLMMALGAAFPKFFEKIGGALTISLIAVIVLELVEVFVFGIHHDFIDWIVALIFCGYIGYDWDRASKIPKTIDNAVDSAAALYMDIINLFIRILRILGRASK